MGDSITSPESIEYSQDQVMRASIKQLSSKGYTREQVMLAHEYLQSTAGTSGEGEDVVPVVPHGKRVKNGGKKRKAEGIYMLTRRAHSYTGKCTHLIIFWFSLKVQCKPRSLGTRRYRDQQCNNRNSSRHC